MIDMHATFGPRQYPIILNANKKSKIQLLPKLHPFIIAAVIIKTFSITNLSDDLYI